MSLESRANKIVSAYSSFLTQHPILCFTITLIIIAFAFNYAGKVQQSVFEPEDAIPGDIPVIAASNVFSDEFGTVDTATIVVEIDPETINSNELRDLRRPEIIDYLWQITQRLQTSESIDSINEPYSILQQLDNPRSYHEIKNTIDENPLLKTYFTDDGTMAH
jgi:predicted RND superfamily exporter protein